MRMQVHDQSWIILGPVGIDEALGLTGEMRLEKRFHFAEITAEVELVGGLKGLDALNQRVLGCCALYGIGLDGRMSEKVTSKRAHHDIAGMEGLYPTLFEEFKNRVCAVQCEPTLSAADIALQSLFLFA